MREGDTIRNTEVKARNSMVPFEGAKVNGALGSTAVSRAHLKCLYTKGHSMRNELEALFLSQSYEITGINET